MTSKDLDLLIKSSMDPFFFSSLAQVVNPIHGKVPFNLYPFQNRILYEFLVNRFTIVLKTRQMGLTELIALYALWLAIFTPFQNIQMISLKDRVAKRLLRRIKFIYKNLPEVIREYYPVINGRKGEFGTDSEMMFPNGSNIVSVPTTQDAVRSEPVSLLVMDEAAIMKYAETIWASALPSLATGGKAIINSTPYGVGTFYHQTWQEALLNSNGFKPLMIPWHLHPERDQDWYDTMRNALGAKRTAQEIDCSFLASGDTVFDLADIKDLEDNLIDYPPVETRLKGNLIIFHKPRANARYFIGVDVSTGRAKDYSAFSVMDSNGQEAACFKGRVPVNTLRDILAKIGIEYNTALIAVEANGVGEAVIAGLQDINYENLYYTIEIVKETRSSEPLQKKKPGFYTGTNNRLIIINGLEQDIREGNTDIKNPFFISEAFTFIYDDMNRPVAMAKGEYIGDGSETYADDAIIAEAITNHIRKKNKLHLDVVNPR